MKGLSVAGAVALVSVAIGTAVAAPATQEEANRLTAVFQDYVGHPGTGRPSAVTVTPHGEGYTVTLDPARLFGLASAFGVEVTAGDVTAELTAQPDGRWHVAMAGLPPIGITDPDGSLSLKGAPTTFEGVYDPALHAFASSQTITQGWSSHSTGKTGAVDTTLTENNSSTATAVAAAPGTVDRTFISTTKDLELHVVTGATGTPDSVPSELARFRVASVQSSAEWHHMPASALDELWRFLVAHPTRPELVAAQAELKTRLKAALPLASSVSGSATLSTIAVSTPLGVFGLDSAGERYASGIDGGDTTFALQVSGLTLPDRVMPPWAVSLVPTSLDYAQTTTALHLTDALNLAIDDLDLSQDKPITPEDQAGILAALGGDHTLLTVAPSTLKTALMTLSVHGDVKIDKPAVRVTMMLAATGLDKTMEAVRLAAPGDPNGAQAIAMLMAAKALGKAEGPDSYSWVVNKDADGALTVNGNPLPGAGPGTVKPRKAGPKP